MIANRLTSEKIFGTLDEAKTWGEYIAKSCDWKFLGSAVVYLDHDIGFSPIWEY